MIKKGIHSEINLINQRNDLLLQRFCNAEHVPESLVEVVRKFQEEIIAQGITSETNLQNSHIERCEIKVGSLYFDFKNFDKEKIREHLQELEQEKKLANNEEYKKPGQIDFQFTGVNQFGSVTIQVRDKRFQVEFSRLQRRISSFITTENALKPKAHLALYKKMEEALKPIPASALSQLLILQGAAGLGKSHCTEHYFYHDANKHHQMVVWLSGESQNSFIRDWEALAQQFHYIDSKRRNESDTALIHHWCEKQLGQWLFIIDDVQIDIDWLKNYLPQKGGHVLMTTSKPWYSLPKQATILSFLPLSFEDSGLLLKTWLGNYWDASGFEKEEQALAYLSRALSGYPALLTQMALLVRRKGLSFERLHAQFENPETRNLLLSDTVFDQLEGKTFNCVLDKSIQQVTQCFKELYPQLNFEEELKRFIIFLKQHASEIEKKGCCFIDDNLLREYWKPILKIANEDDLTCLRDVLKLLPWFYSDNSKHWVIAIAGLHGLESLKYSAISAPKVVFELEKPSKLKAWCLPTINPYFIPRPALTAEIKIKLPNKARNEQTAQLILAAASGMGGIGKTELARYYITELYLSSHYQKRFWFNASNYFQLRNEFYDLAVSLNLIEPKQSIEDKELIHQLHRWFNINSGWLIILDNADDYNSIAEWIPKEGGAVLVTTRDPHPGTLAPEQIVPIPLLTPKEAEQWLYELARRNPDLLSKQEKIAAKVLVENLGYLPLAIAQAAAYLREQVTVSIEIYLSHFNTTLGDLTLANQIEGKENIDKDADAKSRQVVASICLLSIKAIESYAKEKGMVNLSSSLLAVCSYLAPKDIPIYLLECWFKESYTTNDFDKKTLGYLVDEYIGLLLNYSLIERKGTSNLLSMHNLVQLFIRSRLTDNYQETCLMQLMTCINKLYKDIDATEVPLLIEQRESQFLAHSNSILNYVKKERFFDAKPEKALFYHNISSIYFKLGNPQRQKELLEEALGILVAHYGRGHWKVGITFFNLAQAHLQLGELKLAYETMGYAYNCLLSHPLHSSYPHTQIAKRWVIDIEQKMSSQIDPQNSSASKLSLFTPSAVKMRMTPMELLKQIAQKNTEAVNSYRANDYRKALALWQNALEIAQGIPKEEYPSFYDEFATLHANIGKAHKHLGHYKEAIKSFKTSIALREEKYGINCQEAKKNRDKLAEVERLFSVNTNDCNSFVSVSPKFFTSTDEPLSLKLRVGLKNEVKLTQILVQSLPAGLTLGKAHAQGDCFFDALAQCLNRMNSTDVNTDKYLRMLCHDYYEKNKALVDKLNDKDYGGIDKEDNYSMVQYTVEECEKHFHGRSPIWGRPYVEGIMLCNQLNLRGLCIIEILEHPETKEPIPSFHWVNQESYTSISEQEAKERLSNSGIPTLVVEQNSLHFVPLLVPNSDNYNSKIMPFNKHLLALKENEKDNDSKKNNSVLQPKNFITNQSFQENKNFIPKLNKQFLKAIINGNHDEVSKLLDQDCSIIMARDKQNYTALHLSIIHFNYFNENIFYLLAKKGPELLKNSLDNIYNTSLLYLACLNSLDNIIEFLIEHENKINDLTKEGDSPLLRAAKMGKLDIVKLLISRGAKANVRNPRGLTPFLYAAKNGHTPVMEHLIESGFISINEVQRSGQTALHLATLNNNKSAVELLINKKANLNIKDLEGKNAFLVAAENKFNFIVKLLLNGSDINTQENRRGWSALHFACDNEDEALVNSLIGAEKIDIDTLSKDDRSTPLHLACKNKNFNIVQKLLDKSALINAQQAEKYTSLHLAAMNNCIDVVRVLLSNNAEIHIQTLKEETALCCAAKNGNKEIVVLLLKKGANVNFSLKHARVNHNEDAVKLLLEAQKPISELRSELDGHFIINQECWVLHMARKIDKGDKDHVFLIVEGVENNERYLYYFDLVNIALIKTQIISINKLIGLGLIRNKKFKGNFDEKIILKVSEVNQIIGVNLAHESWGINYKFAKKLIDSIEKDDTPINFHLLGKESLSGLSSSHVGHNCFTWARNKINGLGHSDIKVKEDYADWFGASSKRYLPDHRQNNHSFWSQKNICPALGVTAAGVAVVGIVYNFLK